MVTYHLGGKNGRKCKLEFSESLIAIQPRKILTTKGKMPSSTQKILRQMDHQVRFENIEVDVFDMKRMDTDIEKFRGILKQDENLNFAGRVLKDPISAEPVVYTKRIFLKLHDDANRKHINQVLSEIAGGWRVERHLPYAPNAVIAISESANELGIEVFDYANELLEMGAVSLSHPELIRRKTHRNIFKNQWHIGDRKIDGTLISASASVQEAWAFNKGAGVTIAVIDDGIDLKHPEFSNGTKILAPWDAVEKIPDPNPKLKIDNHGTPCAGVACASGIYGASGVAPDSLLMPIRLQTGIGDLAEADAIYWAASHGADVISCSWGPPCGDWWDEHDPRHNEIVGIPDYTSLAIQNAVEKGRMGKGCVITWAAGNGNESVDYDGYASHPDVIAIGACNDKEKRSVYSDYGDAVWCCFPSDDPDDSMTDGIWTTDRRGNNGYSNTDYVGDFGGTSSSCPGVAGVAALIIAENNTLTHIEVKKILADTADKIDLASGGYDLRGHSKFYGYGRINARAAVEAANTI